MSRIANARSRTHRWKHQLHAIAEAAGIELARLPSAKSSPEKVLLAALLKKVVSVSNRWRGDALR